MFLVLFVYRPTFVIKGMNQLGVQITQKKHYTLNIQNDHRKEGHECILHKEFTKPYKSLPIN